MWRLSSDTVKFLVFLEMDFLLNSLGYFVLLLILLFRGYLTSVTVFLLSSSFVLVVLFAFSPAKPEFDIALYIHCLEDTCYVLR